MYVRERRQHSQRPSWWCSSLLSVWQPSLSCFRGLKHRGHLFKSVSCNLIFVCCFLFNPRPSSGETTVIFATDLPANRSKFLCLGGPKYQAGDPVQTKSFIFLNETENHRITRPQFCGVTYCRYPVQIHEVETDPFIPGYFMDDCTFANSLDDFTEDPVKAMFTSHIDEKLTVSPYSSQHFMYHSMSSLTGLHMGRFGTFNHLQHTRCRFGCKRTLRILRFIPYWP